MDDLRVHRVERYLDLGFSPEDAASLADAKWDELDSLGRIWTRPLHWLKVSEALAGGCSHELALQIFA